MVCRALVLYLALAAVATACAEDDAARNDVAAKWRSIAEANRPWLEPSAEPLAYRLDARLIEWPAGRRNEARVWLDGDRFRFELEPAVKPDSDFPMPSRYVFVCDGERMRYLAGPKALTEREPRPARRSPRLRQGVTLLTAMHSAYRGGLPADARLVREPTTSSEPRTVAIEADFAERRGEAGLGLFHSHLGRSGFALGKVRLVFDAATLTPIREEHLQRGQRFEFDGPWLDVADGIAPTTVRFVTGLPTFGSDGPNPEPDAWVMRFESQSLDDRWLLREAFNEQRGKRIAEMRLTDASTEAIYGERFALEGD